MKKRVWLRQLRVSRGLTQDTVANRAFIDRSFYAQIENGTRDPSMTVAVNIANVLGIQPQLFFVDHLHTIQTTSSQSYVIQSQCDLELRYTWLWHPYVNTDCYIGMRDDEIVQSDGSTELMYLKKQAILQDTALEKVVILLCNGTEVPCLVRVQPLLDEDDRINGVYSEITAMPALISHGQSLVKQEPRSILHGHILYFYEDIQAYVDNVIKYVKDGVDYGYHVWIIESASMYLEISARLNDDELLAEKLELIHYVDSSLAFKEQSDVHSEPINVISECIEPILNKGSPLRLWIHVPYDNEPLDYRNISSWENQMDANLCNLRVTSICVYDGTNLPAKFQTALMRNHEYFMTDHELVYSPLYMKKRTDSIHPSLAKQKNQGN